MAVENKPTTSNDEEQAKTALFLVVIAIFGFWYWYCSDGIRACLETHLSIMKRFSSMLAMAI